MAVSRGHRRNRGGLGSGRRRAHGMKRGKPRALVGIVMGSESDRPVMEEAAKVLADFGVASEVAVRSAHRTPDAAAKWARTAKARGLEVIIAGAGGAAHLAGAM